jgi:hypothetical protein
MTSGEYQKISRVPVFARVVAAAQRLLEKREAKRCQNASGKETP